MTYDGPESPDAPAEATLPARVLVVDDSGFNRIKLTKAVARLGHDVEAAEDGVVALERLRAGSFDAVLLDIVMPHRDGFDVLREMKADADLADVPVIVVSALDEETESVVRAIHLGAEDFLPKTFDPVILEARLGASLTRKRLRDRERAYFRAVERLTRAAETIEHGSIGADSVDVDDVADRGDALGRLAAVFRGMAAEIYERELRMKRTIRMLQGSLLVIAFGVLWGLLPSLSRMAATDGAAPLTLAFQVDVVVAVLCLGVAGLRGRIPRLGRREIGYYAAWALLSGVVQKLVIFHVAGHVEAAMLSLILSVQGVVVFLMAATTRFERASPRRLAGLGVGLAGVVTVLIARLSGADTAQIAILAVALLLPLAIALEGMLMAARQPAHVDYAAGFGLMMAISACLLAPFVWLGGGPAGPDLVAIGPGGLLVVAMAVVTAVAGVMGCQMIRIAGALFSSQSAYVKTIAGIVWGALLLDEQVSALTWGAIVLILAGLYLVGPEIRDVTVTLNRSFSGRTRRPR